MAIKKKKLSEFALFSSVVGLFTMGVDKNNKSVKVPLQEVFEAAAKAEDATSKADTAAEGADDAKDGAVALSALLTANPPKIISNYWHTFEVATKAYINTGVYCRGEGFTIKHFYSSVEEMHADYGNPQIAIGEVVSVRASVGVEGNANIYIKVADAAVEFEFWLDMSGAIGPTGKTPQFSVGAVSSGIDPMVNITADGLDEDGNPKFKFNLVLPKGERGEPGIGGGSAMFYSSIEERDTDLPNLPVGTTAVVFESVPHIVASGDKVRVLEFNTAYTPDIMSYDILNDFGGAMMLLVDEVAGTEVGMFAVGELSSDGTFPETGVAGTERVLMYSKFPVGEEVPTLAVIYSTFEGVAGDATLQLTLKRGWNVNSLDFGADVIAVTTPMDGTPPYWTDIDSWFVRRKKVAVSIVSDGGVLIDNTAPETAGEFNICERGPLFVAMIILTASSSNDVEIVDQDQIRNHLRYAELIEAVKSKTNIVANCEFDEQYFRVDIPSATYFSNFEQGSQSSQLGLTECVVFDSVLSVAGTYGVKDNRRIVHIAGKKPDGSLLWVLRRADSATAADVSALVLAPENKTRIQELAGDLPALASGRTPAKVRGVDDQGNSVNLTPAQLATMAGIDYSNTTEQLVPGEGWPNKDGERKRIYTRTFIVNFPSGYGAGKIVRGTQIAGPIINIDQIVSFRGSRIDSNLDVPSGAVGDISQLLKVSAGWSFYGFELEVRSDSAYAAACTLIFNLEYTRR